MNKRSTIIQRLRRPLLATGMASVLVLAGCGSDDDATDTTTAASVADTTAITAAEPPADTTAHTEHATADTTAATTVDSGTGEAADIATVCDAVIQLDQTVPTGMATKDEANALLDDAIAAADAETATMLTDFQAALQPVLDNPQDGPGEEFLTQYSGVLGWVGESCDVQTLDVHTEEYHFVGLPEELDAGYYIVNLVNDGNEAHELNVARINDDVTLSIDELIALPEGEVDTMIQFAGDVFAPPGATVTGSLTLTEPGRFAAVCFIPTGTTADAEGTGPPHAAQGMVQEITVV